MIPQTLFAGVIAFLFCRGNAVKAQSSKDQGPTVHFVRRCGKGMDKYLWC